LAVAAGLSRSALHSQLAAGLRVVLHLVREHDGTRRLRQIGVLTQRANGLVAPASAVTFHGSAMTEGPAMQQLLALLR
jgi:pilus assembly protein CpaF